MHVIGDGHPVNNWSPAEYRVDRRETLVIRIYDDFLIGLGFVDIAEVYFRGQFQIFQTVLHHHALVINGIVDIDLS